MTHAPKLGQLILKAVARRGLRQDQAAKIVGCSQGSLSRWIRGEVPKTPYLRGLAKLTETSTDELLALIPRGTSP